MSKKIEPVLCAVCGEPVSSREEGARFGYPNMTSTVNCRWRPCPQQAVVHDRCQDGAVWDCGRHPWSRPNTRDGGAA